MMPLKNWPEYLRRLEDAGELWARTWAPQDEQIRAELYRQIMMNLALGYFVYFQADPDHPDFTPFLNSVFLLQPNPDDTYFYTPLDGRGVYRLSGERGSVKLLTVTIGKDMMGTTDKMSPQFLEKDLDELPRAPDGGIDVLLSTERPAGHAGAWLSLHPEAEYLLIRQRSYDWGNEADARLAIQRLDADPLKRRLTIEDIDSRLEGVLAFAKRLSRFWLDFVNRVKESHAPNTLHVAPFQQMGGVQVQVYWQAIYELQEDEALILETDIPEQAPYWNVQLNDELWNTIEYVYRQSSLNGHQARLDEDGRFRAVISAGDPGVPNWLDVMGHRTGTLVGRWYACSSAPVPTLKRVKLAEVRQYLPEQTPVVSREERRAAILERSRAAQLRRRW
jgi:hypothetical protein